jgi:Rod binding domain-containing protein
MPKDEKARLQKAAEGFEAQWFSQIMNEAKSAQGPHDSFATQTFRGMMNDTLARTMAETHTLGLADMLVRQLQSRISPDSSTPGTDGAGETPTATTETTVIQPEIPQ